MRQLIGLFILVAVASTNVFCAEPQGATTRREQGTLKRTPALAVLRCGGKLPSQIDFPWSSFDQYQKDSKNKDLFWDKHEFEILYQGTHSELDSLKFAFKRSEKNPETIQTFIEFKKKGVAKIEEIRVDGIPPAIKDFLESSLRKGLSPALISDGDSKDKNASVVPLEKCERGICRGENFIRANQSGTKDSSGWKISIKSPHLQNPLNIEQMGSVGQTLKDLKSENEKAEKNSKNPNSEFCFFGQCPKDEKPETKPGVLRSGLTSDHKDLQDIEMSYKNFEKALLETLPAQLKAASIETTDSDSLLND